MSSSEQQTYKATVTVVYFFVVSSVCWKLKHFPHLDVWHIWLWKASPSVLGPVELSRECEHHCKKLPVFVLFHFRYKLTSYNLNTEHFIYFFFKHKLLYIEKQISHPIFSGSRKNLTEELFFLQYTGKSLCCKTRLRFLSSNFSCLKQIISWNYPCMFPLLTIERSHSALSLSGVRQYES